jgi:hypothetical protein
LGTEAKQAKEASRKELFQLYSAETRKEFHELFIMCLRGFAEGLEKLVAIRKSGKQTEDANNLKRSFAFYTTSVMRYGTCLQQLTRTHAIQTHLCFILSLPRRESNLASTLTLMPELHVDDTVRDEDEIEPLFTDTGVSPLVKPYRDWLRLIIAEFDAVDILIGHFVRKLDQQMDISIKVVMPSTVDDASLPWEELFASSSYIPDTRAGGLSNQDLLHFLTNIESGFPKALDWVGKLNSLWLSGNVQQMMVMIDKEELVKRYMKELEKGDELTEHNWWRWWLVPKPRRPLLLMPDWLPMLDQLATMLDQHLQLPVLTSEIEKILKLLGDSASFFGKIAQTNCENGFKKGRIHCEACLASLLADGATESIGANEKY